MKQLLFIFSTIFICLLTSCNKSPIPDKSVLEELTPTEIADIIKYEESNPTVFADGGFADLYAEMRESLNRLCESERLSFAPLTYIELSEASYYADNLYNDDDFVRESMSKKIPSDPTPDWKFRLNAICDKVGEKYPLAAKFIRIW